MSGETVISIEGLYKEYRLGNIGYGTLREDLQSWWARIRGKEDPNSLITQKSSHERIVNKHFFALEDINLKVNQGDVLGIIGKNGAGKSTLLKILSRVTYPTKGEIKIKGRIAALLEVGTGFHGELTGRENIYLNGAILGMKKREIDKKLDEIIDFAEIEEFIDTPVKRYSSGMTVRLAFAVAAHLDAEILIFDEVLAVGDAAFQRKCLGKMDSVATKQGRTVLFVSHNMGTIGSLCKTGALLHKGSLITNGDINSVINQYASVGLNNKNSIVQYKTDETKMIQLRKVSLANQNGEYINDIDRTSDLHIIVEYEVRSENEGVHIAINFDRIDGVPIYHFCDIDFVPGRVVKREPGLHRFTAVFPGGILNVATYRIRVGIARYGGEIYDVDNEGVVFSLYDSGTHASISNDGEQSPGVIAVPIKCLSEKI